MCCIHRVIILNRGSMFAFQWREFSPPSSSAHNSSHRQKRDRRHCNYILLPQPPPFRSLARHAHSIHYYGSVVAFSNSRFTRAKCWHLFIYFFFLYLLTHIIKKLWKNVTISVNEENSISMQILVSLTAKYGLKIIWNCNNQNTWVYITKATNTTNNI